VNKNSTKLVFEVAPLGSTSFVVDNGAAGGEWTTIFTLTNSEANLGGTYDSTTSWTIQAKLSDKFTSSNPTIVSTTVGTEKVINACDKYGRFGIGKIPELGPAGSVDAAGNIYAGGKQIQQHQLTSNDGTSRTIYVDPDTIVENGFYYLLNGPNRPFDTNGYLIVERYYSDNKYIVQTFKNAFNGNQYIRVKNYGVWGPWVEQVRADHPNLINSGWLSLSNGVEFKKIGEVVYVNLYKLPIKEGTNFSIGTLPIGYRPRKEMMKTSNTWVVMSETVNIKIETNGDMSILGASIPYDRDLSDQISFAI
jgi:hypothetical protein